jgi:CO dehydrogenase/acetyl-CoA synthase beta subunit
MNAVEAMETQEDAPIGVMGHDGQIAMVRDMIEACPSPFRRGMVAPLRDGKPFPGRDADTGCGRMALVLAEDAAVELGAPSQRSVNLFLWSRDVELIPEGLWLAGPDCADLKGQSVSYAQVVMAGLKPGIDPLDASLENLMNLTNRIAGFMTRSLQGRIWIRIHRDLAGRGFSLVDVGGAMASAYAREASGTVEKLGIVLVAHEPDLVSRLQKIQARARVINGENRKLQLEADGSFSCDDLNCSSCDEKTYCDVLRELIVKRSEHQ